MLRLHKYRHSNPVRRNDAASAPTPPQGPNPASQYQAKTPEEQEVCSISLRTTDAHSRAGESPGRTPTRKIQPELAPQASQSRRVGKTLRPRQPEDRVDINSSAQVARGSCIGRGSWNKPPHPVSEANPKRDIVTFERLTRWPSSLPNEAKPMGSLPRHDWSKDEIQAMENYIKSIGQLAGIRPRLSSLHPGVKLH